MKDIVLDTMIAKNLCNPVAPIYKDFIKWLSEDGILCYSQFLLNEYNRGTSSSPSPTNILALIDRQLRRGINAKVSTEAMKQFTFSKKQIRVMQTHKKDYPIMKTVLLSNRKYFVSGEATIVADLNSFPGHNCLAACQIGHIPYRN
jgi:hypothetical protein